ncbi:MAG TPA: hypothetical protein VEI97_06895, partial [bacterium]|nr:hypothetical protein [bacterium]
ANTDLVTNADGYYAPNGLLTETGSLTANTFPFKLIVDEGAGSGGNRGEADNGGTATGNYRVDLDGWQQDNLTNNGVNNGWTGFGVLHQGQSAANTLQLDRAQLTGSTFRLDTAIIAKYIDPRGGNNAAEKRANRLPKNPADVRLFVYRMPFGAIDAELVRPLGETGGLVPNNIVSNTTVRFQVRDWDARATESTQPDLKDELNPSLVPSGTSGPPTVQVDVPGVTATPALLNLVDDDSAFGGDPEVDSGVARDPLFYQGVVQNSAASGGGQTAGPRKGLLKAEDPENLLDRSAYEFALDPTLTPLTGNKPELVTYQAFTVSLGGGPANDPPTATVALAAGTNPTVA